MSVLESERKKTKGKRAKRKKEELPDVNEEINSILLKEKGEKLLSGCCSYQRVFDHGIHYQRSVF